MNDCLRLLNNRPTVLLTLLSISSKKTFGVTYSATRNSKSNPNMEAHNQSAGLL